MPRTTLPRRSSSTSRGDRAAAKAEATDPQDPQAGNGAELPGQASLPALETAALAALYGRPGFKLRRAHQAAASVFAEECRAFGVTTTQYGILVVLRERPGLDQIGVAKALGLDRSTTAMVVAKLESRALLRRSPSREDRRRLAVTLTAKGIRLLTELTSAAERARQRLLSPLTVAEAEMLNALLEKLLNHHDAVVRVPLVRPAMTPT
ncbi:MarR family transcriptional regulator [Roseomonas hellenica]|uniref:MarR family transcriptional regulator n=1 Tax=Plastoroseomonas hellenica TaxID=2687306 RepID=A0ABS5EZ23_9PROT|nr:MarR family transcriptional regulator [Plastoroseomonas hellenica]MBR0665545.1 MarR family transcriptional regulator [Plastoroseomonas hellenica]